MATSTTPAHHQQEPSRVFLIGNERQVNPNFVDREKIKTTENGFTSFKTKLYFRT